MCSPARTEISLIIFRQQTGRDASTRMFQVGAIDSESFRELTQSPTLGCSVRLPAQPARRRGRRLSESQRKKTNQETRNSGITGGTASVPSMFRKTGVSPVIFVSVEASRVGSETCSGGLRPSRFADETELVPPRRS